MVATASIAPDLATQFDEKARLLDYNTRENTASFRFPHKRTTTITPAAAAQDVVIYNDNGDESDPFGGQFGLQGLGGNANAKIYLHGPYAVGVVWDNAGSYDNANAAAVSDLLDQAIFSATIDGEPIGDFTGVECRIRGRGDSAVADSNAQGNDVAAFFPLVRILEENETFRMKIRWPGGAAGAADVSLSVYVFSMTAKK